METVFCISNCLAENQTKFATCTLLVGALTWWNSHVRIVGSDAAYVMTWIELKKKMADKYCPRNEMKKIKTELWNLEVQGSDLTRYNQHFQELALLCVRTCPEESDRVERYIGGLPDSIHESVAASKPKTMQEATEMATGLMEKKIRTYAERQAANKRKFEDTSQNNQGQQQPPKRQDVARAYAVRSDNRQQYAGSRPLCIKCNFNHDGPCIPRCCKCNKIGHLARDCRSLTNANVANNQRMENVFRISNCLAENQVKFATCTLLASALTWWNSHVRIVGSDAAYVMTWIELKKKMANKYCPRNEMKKIKTELWNLEQPPKRQDVVRAYAAGSGNRQQYAGPRPLYPKCNFNHDGPCIPRCYKCNKIGHLARNCRSPTNANVADNQRGNGAGQKATCCECRAVIVCADKIVRIPWGRETLIFHGDGSNQEHETRFNIISCAKTQKYMLKGCQVFLAHVTTKEAEGKSEKKRLENVPIVRDFPEVFPKDLPDLPPTRQVVFQIDLIPGAASVARAPYRLAPSELKELSEQLKELSDKGFIRPSSSPWGASVLFVKKKGRIISDVH
nr:putative reverse transcriptase domain-containing protein [Tanacetum cinerariifolium]